MQFFKASLVGLLLCALGGCSNDQNADDVNAQPITKEQIQALPTPVLAPVTMTYRVSGNARGIAGSYTDSNGSEVAIPATATENGVAYAPLPWEKSVQISGELMRKQHITVFLAAHDAFNSGVSVNVEMIADGKSVNSGSGVSPRIYVIKH